MLQVEDREEIRRAYFTEGKSMRRIAEDLHHSRDTVRNAITSAEVPKYSLRKPKPAPVLGPYKERIDELLKESKKLPRKQRYTSRRIYEVVRDEGYEGSESGVRGYISRLRRDTKKVKVYMPLDFDPGVDAQVDWGEGIFIMDGEKTEAQLFNMRLCYSRRQFMMAFPMQRQEAFFAGHVAAFHHFGGVPQRIWYDNLKSAVLRILEGRNREEQVAFKTFRSHYLFESRFCTPGQGNEKGSVEHAVGYGRRNFMVPPPEVSSFEELNAHLLAKCLADDARTVARQPMSIGEAWEIEVPHLLLLQDYDLPCCVTKPVKVNGFSQVIFETNHYSVPTDQTFANLVLRAFPFHVEIIHLDKVIAEHARCYERERDICDPLHYLPLLEQRPRAFEHAKPIRQWRKEWPPAYEELLARLQMDDAEERGVKTFIQVLQLHRDYPAAQIEQAVVVALEHGCLSLDGIKHCLHQICNPDAPVPRLDLAEHPRLVGVGEQPVNLNRYDQLLPGGSNGH
jgi:transposase